MLCERHIAAFVAMAAVRGYPQRYQGSVSPNNVAGEYEQCAGFSLFQRQGHCRGSEAPATLRLTGFADLPLILLCSPVSAGLKNKIPTRQVQ